MILSIASHLPVLQVAVPLLAAPISLLLGRGRLTWLFASAVAWLTFAIAIALATKIGTDGALSYHLGGWPPPIGIEYRIDSLSALVLLLISGVAAAVFPYARPCVESEVSPQNQGLFFTVMLLALAGMLGVVATGDAFNVFVFLEIASLSSYVLVAMGGDRDRRALTAAYNYLIMGTIGATFFVIGIGLAYMMTGTLNMQDLAARLPAMAENRTVPVAFAFINVGIALKLAMFPLHLWLPNAYTFAPSPVSAFLAATSTKVAVYLYLRILLGVFGVSYAFDDLGLDTLFMPLVVLGMVVTSVVAIFQVDIKRMLAYSSVAQIGYMILGLSITTVTGVTGAILHLFNHGLMKGALFMTLGAVALRKGRTGIDAFAGVGKQMPWTMAAFVAGGLSLIGVPLTVGFVSKWYLIRAALEQGLWPLAILMVATSLLAVIYIWRVVDTAYFDEPKSEAPARTPIIMLVAIWSLVAANLYFGIDTDLTIGLAERAAQILLQGTPR